MSYHKGGYGYEGVGAIAAAGLMRRAVSRAVAPRASGAMVTRSFASSAARTPVALRRGVTGFVRAGVPWGNASMPRPSIMRTGSNILGGGVLQVARGGYDSNLDQAQQPDQVAPPVPPHWGTNPNAPRVPPGNGDRDPATRPTRPTRRPPPSAPSVLIVQAPNNASPVVPVPTAPVLQVDASQPDVHDVRPDSLVDELPTETAPSAPAPSSPPPMSTSKKIAIAAGVLGAAYLLHKHFSKSR